MYLDIHFPNLWWTGPEWLSKPCDEWPEQALLPPNDSSDEERELCMSTIVHPLDPLLQSERYSKFSKLQLIIAWIYRFVMNFRSGGNRNYSLSLSVSELLKGEAYWIKIS